MKLKLLLMGALASVAAAGAAHAAGTVTFSFDTTNAYATPAGQSVVIDFDSNTSSAAYTLTGFTTTNGSTANVAAAPNAGGTTDTSNYGYVSAASSPGMLTLATATSNLSFLYGSVDTYNSFNFFDASGSPVGGTITGSQIDPNAGSNNSGTVNFAFSTPVSRIQFITSQNSLEVDNIAVSSAVSAAPEPGTWVLMLGGVAILGFTLRMSRKRPAMGLAA